MQHHPKLLGRNLTRENVVEKFFKKKFTAKMKKAMTVENPKFEFSHPPGTQDYIIDIRSRICDDK